MADFVFNISAGRFNEFAERVNDNDPANSVLTLVCLKVSEADATLRDYATLAALLAGANTEADFTNYARIELDDGDIAGSTVDNANDLRYLDIADQTYSSAGNGSNNTTTDLITCYDSDSTGGTDANVVPMFCHDCVFTTNGGDVTLQVNASGLARATTT